MLSQKQPDFIFINNQGSTYGNLNIKKVLLRFSFKILQWKTDRKIREGFLILKYCRKTYNHETEDGVRLIRPLIFPLKFESYTGDFQFSNVRD